jgi:hypothetical protein
MTWNDNEKYPRGWEDESVYPSLLHWKADWSGRQARQGQSPSHNERNPQSGPVGYRRRGPVIPTPLPRGIHHWHR